MNKLVLNVSLALLLILSSCAVKKNSQQSPAGSKAEVLEIINRVNRYWQNTHPEPGNAFWHVAAYHTGNMEAYAITKNEEYRKYSEKWAEANQWKGAKSDNRAEWKYNYGEKDDYVLFGDWQICFQTYIDLYKLDKDPKKIARAIEVMEYQMSTPNKDYWWWADGLYMVMPVMTKLHQVTGNKLYLEKLHEYLSYANSIMYDQEAKLYYRDAKYVYPKHKSANGKKDFWARGDGWVFAGLAKVLKDLPYNDAHRNEYLSRFQDMAQAIKSSQQPEGYWTRSMLDPEHAPGPETSGTAFFTYGMLWGINNGILDQQEYMPVVSKAWNYLSTQALQADGKIGFVQPIGERAIPGQVVDRNSTADFGVGAFLLAASEMYRHLNNASVPSAVLPGVYADPHIAAFGNKFYLYPTTDGSEGWMSDHFTAWSSKDLVNWKNEGTILDLKKDLSWAKERAWAPAIATKNGKYYYYYSADVNIGVAVADKPTGPFKDPLGKPLVPRATYKGQMIDPMVFVDDDGSAYLYFGQGSCHVVKLNDDMISFDPAQLKSFKPEGYNEGAFVFKRNGKYYLMWSEYDTRDPRYSVAYATSDSPMGPFVKAARNPVLKGEGIVKGAGHHSVVQVPGKDEWYIAYHRFRIPGGNGYNRETCISPMRFDEQGAILPVDVFEPAKSVTISR